MASRKINGHYYHLAIFSLLMIPVIHCIVTPVNATLPLISSTRIVSTPTSSPSISSSSSHPSTSSSSSSTTTITPIDTSASAAGIASPVYSDTLGRMMAASASIQNIQNVSSSSPSSSSSSGSSSSDSHSTESPFTPNSGPPLLGGTLTPNGLSTSKSFVDIVKDYERYKMTKYSGPRNIQPSLIYSGDLRSINNREQLLSPSTLQGYNNNNQQNVGGNNKLINGINGDAFAYSYLGQNDPSTGPHPTSGSSSSASSGSPTAEDYLSWTDDEVTPYGMVKGFGESAVSPDGYFPTSALDYSSNYDFELLPQGTKTHNHEPVSSSQVVGTTGGSRGSSGSGSYSSNNHHQRPSNSNPMNSDLLTDSSGFFNYHSLVTNMDANEELPILIESYVVNYPPLSEKPVAHSLSAFTFDHRPSHHHHHPMHHHSHNPVESNSHHHGGFRHQSSLLASPSMSYPMIGPKPTSERVFISPYLYSRPCKYDCFATPLQDMKYGLMNFLEGAHNHGRR